MQKLEAACLGIGSAATKSGKSDDIEGLVVSKIDDIETQDLVVIALKLKPKQTKSEIKAMLQNWGKKVGNWFQGGNLNTRMVNKSLVKKEDVNGKREVIFSLTRKGELVAVKLINELK